MNTNTETLSQEEPAKVSRKTRKTAKAQAAPSGESTPNTAPKKKSARKNLMPPWQPGQSGNPKGRPKGSRNKLTENLLADLADFYEKEGKDLIRRVRDENPTALLQSIVKLVPKEASLSIQGGVSVDLSVEQRRRIAESWLLSNKNTLDSETVIDADTEQPETPVLPVSDPNEPALRPLKKAPTVADRQMIEDDFSNRRFPARHPHHKRGLFA